MDIILKTEEEIAIMAEAGHRLAKVLNAVESAVAPGVTTKSLDMLAEDLIRASGCTPAFLGYAPAGAGGGFPATLCTSVNSVVVHGLPSAYELKEGDIVSLDLGLIYKGFYSDMAVTVGVGPVDAQKKKLIYATRESLMQGIKAAKVGNALGDIGAAIYACVKEAGFDVVRTLTGHGVGRALHEDPYVFNSGRKGEGEKLVPGMVIAIEPMVVAGNYKVKQLKDDSFVTADDAPAAHFEHTIAITKHGPRILTK